jgi:hypothetical protein
MNHIQRLINNFRNPVARAPEIIQPIIVAFAGAAPFIDGGRASLITLTGGINLVVAGVAAAVGAFLIAFILVVVGSHAAVVNRRTARIERAPTIQQDMAPSTPAWPKPASSARHHSGSSSHVPSPPIPQRCGWTAGDLDWRRL